ncbi:acyltransferase [Lacticaseibacillus kribbianus]|uniref:acyltransferase n=1 Tax=Lacticaseibacillus kribbianus TaxID=2926292 RepID=UPI001CD6A004|nr:acyltransferase [Lacticaseibacillus kribbianus]
MEVLIIVTAPTTALPKKKKRKYLHEVDLMRVFFIFGVLLNHTTTAFAGAMADSQGTPFITLHSLHLFIHFTRMGFMFMTGLVLTLNYYNRNDWPTFFKKRFAGSGWPYLLWNFGLLVLSCALGLKGFAWADFGSTYWSAILHGDQFYLYYILVTLQLYLAFPFMVLLFKKLHKHHLAILVTSFALQMLLMFGIKYGLPHVDRSNWLWWFRAYGVNVFTYQFYFIFGTYVSLHYQQFYDFVKKHLRAIVAATLVLGVGTVPYYFWNLNSLDFTHTAAVSPHQPYMLVYDALMIVTVFAIGKGYAAWRKRGMPHLLEAFISNGAKVSFGIYLDQTIGLIILEKLLTYVHVSDWALFALIPVGYALALGISFGIAWFCYKIPPFGLLIGRPQWHILKKNRKGAKLA